METDASFSRIHRVRSAEDFDRVYSQGAVVMDAKLVVHGARNGIGHCRLGVSLSRKVGSSPVRNRWKRVIREAFRRSKHLMPAGVDIVVRPRKGAQCEYQGVAESLHKLAGQVAKKLELNQ